MTLIQPPMMVHGGTHPARAFRMMVRDLARGSQGVTEGNDLKVSSTATPGAGVRVGDGSAVVRGATFGQGAYTQYNVGDASVPIAPTAGTGRSDLLCLRVEDPEYEGGRNPATDQIGYFHVIPNVPATTSTPPTGMTAIPLARITLPPNCATVTDAMITDLRQIANPRRERKLQIINGFTPSVFPADAGVWQPNWPPNGVVNVDVPAWAVSANFVTTLAGLRVYGETFIGFRNNWAGAPGAEFQVDTDTITAYSNVNVLASDTPRITAPMRGTRQQLRLQGGRYNWWAKGGAEVNSSTALIFDTEFLEGVY
ncbi:hypothetical protein GCM10009760_16320 [Kitasatospora kazusensis]|uniref:Minor tail protein n=1 Tax=Kitasatospora kazusensis TaxID=407974 RepID=A0ABN2Z4M3_9ACTN